MPPLAFIFIVTGNDMNFHCMVKSGLNTQELTTVFSTLDNVGYKSLLLTFSSDDSDYLIKASHAYQHGQVTDLMFAIRPYAMSARYLAMMLKSLNDITGKEAVLNIIAGTFDKEADLFIENTSIHDRKVLAGDFVKRFRSHCLDFNIMPKIYFSGSSEQTISNTQAHGDGIIVLLTDYIKNKPIIDTIDKDKIVRVFIIIDNDYHAAKAKFDLLSKGREKDNCIFGTEEMVLQKLAETGCSNFLVSTIPYDYHNESLNELVRNSSQL